MPQISLYIDKNTLARIEKAATNDKLSISKWVARNIRKVLYSDWPSNYFDLFGSIADDSFVEHKNLNFKADSKRESL